MQTRQETEKLILDSIKSGLTLIGTVIPVSPIAPKNKKDKVIYISSPITTGRRMYRYMTNHALTQIDQIPKDPLLELIMHPNIRESVIFSKTMRAKGYRLLIVPGYFVAEGWTQDHYLDLWTKVIKDFTHVVCFNKGWEYSNGCVREFLVALEAGKELMTYEMKPVDIVSAIEQIEFAIKEIESNGISPSTLYNLLRRIVLAQTKPQQFI